MHLKGLLDVGTGGLLRWRLSSGSAAWKDRVFTEVENEEQRRCTHKEAMAHCNNNPWFGNRHSKYQFDGDHQHIAGRGVDPKRKTDLGWCSPFRTAASHHSGISRLAAPAICVAFIANMSTPTLQHNRMLTLLLLTLKGESVFRFRSEGKVG